MVAAAPRLIPAARRAACGAVASAILAAGPAAALDVLPERGRGPADADRSRLDAVVLWHGPPAVVEVLEAGVWITAAEQGTSPVHLRRLAPGTPVRLRHPDGPGETAVFRPVWTPADLAAWSGPGLRGSQVTALASDPDELWVGTQDAGAARWDGQAWLHLDRRDGLLADGVVAIALQGGTRWLATTGGLARLRPDGTGERWWTEALGGRPTALHVTGERTWLATTAGVVALDDDVVAVLATPGCHRLLDDGEQGVLALCDAPWRLPTGEPVHWPDVPEDVADALLLPRGLLLAPRAGGVLDLARDTLSVAPGTDHLHVTGLARLGTDALAVAGPDGTWILQRDQAVRVDRGAGAPSDVGLVAAPTGTHATAWLGTDRGVALVDAAGTATALPTAPLPAGVGVRAVVPRGPAAGVLSDDGLVWLGAGAPRGWDALAAAVGDDAIDLAHDGAHTWWALEPHALLCLDRTGGLRRWPLSDEALDLDARGDRVAVLTRRGLRTWVKGASMLSPTVDLGVAATHLALAPDGAVWVAGPDAVLRWTPRGTLSWPVTGATAVLPAGPGAIATVQGGLRFLRADGAVHEGWPGVELGAAAALVSDARTLWVLTVDGRLVHGAPEGPVVVGREELGLLGTPRGLVGAREGVWVWTDRGAWRVRGAP